MTQSEKNMTDKTQEQRDAEADAFVQMVKDSMPDTLRGEDIIRICGKLITSYLDTGEALDCVKALTIALAGYYATADDDCDCPKCTANRRAMAH